MQTNTSFHVLKDNYLGMAKDNISSSIAAGPLMCWDMFMDSYHRKMELADDLASLKKLSKKMEWQSRFDFEEALFRKGNTILVTDAALKIVYASSSILLMNGYTPAEVIGLKPSYFQGPDTSEETKSIVRTAVVKQIPFEQTLVNYTKDGLPYNCHITGFALFNAAHKLVNYIAFEKLA